MSKTIKDTFIENMIMNQHGEKIKQIQELMVEKLQKAKQGIERSVVREVSGNNNTEAISEYKLRLKAVEELLRNAHYNFLDISLDSIFIEIGWDNKKKYEELLEALKQPSKCESCVFTYDGEDKGRPVNKPRLAKLHTKEYILNSETTDYILKNTANLGKIQAAVKNKPNKIDEVPTDRIMDNIIKSEEVMENLTKELREKTKESGEEIGKALSNVVSIFFNITNPDTSKDNLADIAKQIVEKLKNNKTSW